MSSSPEVNLRGQCEVLLEDGGIMKLIHAAEEGSAVLYPVSCLPGHPTNLSIYHVVVTDGWMDGQMKQ